VMGERGRGVVVKVQKADGIVGMFRQFGCEHKLITRHYNVV
jgi:hypothetical protein